MHMPLASAGGRVCMAGNNALKENEMGIFGWSLPPGCSNRDIDEAAGVYVICEVCGHYADDCICPECSVCQTAGDKNCYVNHGMIANREQKIGMAQRNVVEARQALCDAEECLAWLTMPDPEENV